jgi:two-component system phosphate regulon sensor histidine kinase PhoR
MIETIQRQANLLERLVENILELSRLDSDMQIFEREPIDLVALSRQITGELEPLTRKKGLQLNFNSPKAPVIIDADPDQLERVIRNLVDNAIKYTKEGSITVSLSIDKNKHLSEQAILQISDTGIGLSKEQISKLFERFYRADPSHNIPGTGLGLSIAKEITKKHNGDIEVESELGRGSTFTVYLPLTQSNHS